MLVDFQICLSVPLRICKMRETHFTCLLQTQVEQVFHLSTLNIVFTLSLIEKNCQHYFPHSKVT